MTSSDMSSCQEKEHEPRTTEEDMTFLTIGVLLGLVPHWRVTITMDHPLDGGWRNRGAGDMSNHKMRSEHINLLELKSSLSNPQVILASTKTLTYILTYSDINQVLISSEWHKVKKHPTTHTQTHLWLDSLRAIHLPSYQNRAAYALSKAAAEEHVIFCPFL